jgi:hypothetical protein
LFVLVVYTTMVNGCKYALPVLGKKKLKLTF